MEKIKPKQAMFARHLFEGKTQRESYRLSYNAENMSQASIDAEARKVAELPQVKAQLQEYLDDAAYVSTLNVAWVLKQYMQIATADVNELIEVRRLCCRHCHGYGHAYQYIDETEWATHLAQTIEWNEANERQRAEKRQPARELPTLAGGVGFWKTNPPHEKCPVCFGDGTLDTHAHSTRNLKGAAKLLYAGVKQTAAGIEIKMRDQDGALDYLAKYLGIDKKTLELSGPNGGPVNFNTLKPEELTDEQLAALIAKQHDNAE